MAGSAMTIIGIFVALFVVISLLDVMFVNRKFDGIDKPKRSKRDRVYWQRHEEWLATNRWDPPEPPKQGPPANG